MGVRLYETTDIVKAICQLAEKLYGQSKRIQIVCANRPMVVSIDQALWQFKQLSFLPHMTDLDAVDPETQPIFVTSNLDKNLNHADIILACNIIPFLKIKDHAVCHPREGGDPFTSGTHMDPRLREDDTFNAELIGICDKEVSEKFATLYQPDQYFVQSNEGVWQQRTLVECA